MVFLKKETFSSDGEGLVIFQDVAAAIQAEKVLKNAGFMVRLVAPPPKFRMGCDLAVEVNLVEQLSIERALEEKAAPYVSIVPLKKGSSGLLGIVKVIDFGDCIMVKAANMKLTYEKKSGIIVNVSGGGCPDIPYLYTEMIDKSLTEAPRPRDIGFTLCALMLNRAFEECLALWQGGKQL